MRIAFYNKLSPLKFCTNSDFGDKKNNCIALNKKAPETSAPNIIGKYGEAFVNMQLGAALFNKAVLNLSLSLSGLSDEEFNNLRINQTFEKDDFIAETLSIIENLSETDKENTCSYFGFRLYQNEENPTGFSILGYPFIPDNGKIMQDTDLKVQEAINKLKPCVIKFLNDNPILCSDKDIEKELNLIVKFFPELRVLFGKKQHKNHSFDVMKHSLKVMQKVVQNSEYNKLNREDKKILLLASLFHDIRKTEGKRDSNHATNGALDTRRIMKRLNLPHNEEVKLYSLIKNHGWLNSVNRVETQEEEYQAQKMAAFNMHQGNLFDLMKIFTEADLKSIKNCDASFNKRKERFEAHSNSISKYINELNGF